MLRILRWLRVIVAIYTLAIAVLLGAQCMRLYRAGNSPANMGENGVHITPVYTVDKVCAALRPVVPAALGYVALVAAALAVQSAAEDERKARMVVAPEHYLHMLKGRVGLLPKEAASEERYRRRIHAGTCAFVLVCAIFGCLYLLNDKNFVSWDLEQVMGRMLVHVAPWVAAAFTTLLAASLCCARSVEKEIAVLKKAEKTGKQPSPAACHMPVGALRMALYTAAIVLIVWGVLNGGMRDVLVKAINICTECIGLG